MINKKYDIYLDNAATTKPYPEVVALNDEINKKYFANPSSTHHLGLESSDLLNKAREVILKTLKLNRHKVIFTSSSTEALNLAIKGYAFKYQNRGKHLITSNIEHPAVLECFYQLRDYFGFKLTILEVDENGVISKEKVEKSIKDDTILVSIMAVNNEIGSINPIKEIAEVVHKHPKCNFLVDTTQGIGKENFDYNDFDMFVVSSHKIHGLKGSGALIYKSTLSFLPLISGGGQEDNLRSGTSSINNALTLAKALNLSISSLNNNHAHVEELYNHLYNELSKLDSIHLNSPKEGSSYILNFSLTNKKAAVIVEGLSELGIYISSVSACHSKYEKSSYVVKAITNNDVYASNTLRVSFSNENTLEEIDIFIKELKALMENLK